MRPHAKATILTLVVEAIEPPTAETDLATDHAGEDEQQDGSVVASQAQKLAHLARSHRPLEHLVGIRHLHEQIGKHVEACEHQCPGRTRTLAYPLKERTEADVLAARGSVRFLPLWPQSQSCSQPYDVQVAAAGQQDYRARYDLHDDK